MSLRLLLPIVALCTVLASCSGSANDDEAALRTLDQSYAEGWKQKGAQAQSEALMAIFANDAVIRPGAGWDPREGKDALREFWFPEGAPETVVKEYKRSPQRVYVGESYGVLSGRYELRFDYDGGNYHQVGNYQTVAEKQSDGKWLIKDMIWNDHRVEE